jgi:hypothetical protein
MKRERAKCLKLNLIISPTLDYFARWMQHIWGARGERESHIHTSDNEDEKEEQNKIELYAYSICIHYILYAYSSLEWLRCNSPN